MSAMPERVEQPTVDEIQAGTAYITADPTAHKVCNWMIAFGRRDAESRLLAAEARVREVEAERDALKEELDNGGAGQVSVVWVGGDEWHDEWCAWYKPEEWPLGSHRAASAFIAQKVATLRAERECLVPLARFAHYDLVYESPFLAGLPTKEQLAAALPILAREAGE